MRKKIVMALFVIFAIIGIVIAGFAMIQKQDYESDDKESKKNWIWSSNKIKRK